MRNINGNISSCNVTQDENLENLHMGNNLKGTRNSDIDINGHLVLRLNYNFDMRKLLQILFFRYAIRVNHQ